MLLFLLFRGKSFHTIFNGFSQAKMAELESGFGRRFLQRNRGCLARLPGSIFRIVEETLGNQRDVDFVVTGK